MSHRVSNDIMPRDILDEIKQHQNIKTLLLDKIKKDKAGISSKMFILSAAYDEIYSRYNGFSLAVLILSSLGTLTEAFRLSTVEYLKKNTSEEDIEKISFGVGVFLLFNGSVITILSGIIRFRNYREMLEELKNKRIQLVTIMDKYSIKYNQIQNMCLLNLMTDEKIKVFRDKIKYNQIQNMCLLNLMTDEKIKVFRDKLEEYNNTVISVNLSQYIRNNDLIKYNKFKANYDIQMKRIDIEKTETMRKIENKLLDAQPPSPFKISSKNICCFPFRKQKHNYLSESSSV